MTGRMDFGFTFGATGAGPSVSRRNEGPFRMVVLGDFSGHGWSGAAHPVPLAQRRPQRVDVDNFDAVLKRMAPTLTVELHQAVADRIELRFEALDDFHPDQLLGKLPAPVITAAVAPSAPAVPAVPSTTPAEDDATTMERLLGRRPEATTNPIAVGLDALIQLIVEPSLLPEAPAGQAQAAADRQAAVADMLRSVLHHPAFQSLEANWRGVHQLVRSLDLDGDLRLYLLDVSRDELLVAGATASVSQALRKIEASDDEAGIPAWSLVLGLWDFGHAEADLGLLASLGQMARQVGGAFMASASAAVLGLPAFADHADPTTWPGMSAADQARWEAWRRSEVAVAVHLTAPRFLLRLPYGAHTDPISGLPFDEMSPRFAHESCLWGSGALACAQLIGQSFMDRGWDLRVGELRDVEDLPAYVLEHEGEKRLLPGAELNLSEHAGERLLALGLMPLLSYKQRNAVRVMSFQAMA